MNPPVAPRPTPSLHADRRTVLRTAVWTAPAVALATSAPAFAASGRTLTLDATSYAGALCADLTGASATLAHGGQPVEGEAVAVTLTGGFTFQDGSVSYVGTTDAGGVVALPAIVSPLRRGAAPAGAIRATAGNEQATATVSAPALGDVAVKYRGPADAGWPTAGITYGEEVTALGRTAFLTGSGTLFTVGGGNVTWSTPGVTSATADVNSANETVIGYTDASGAHFRGAGGVVSDYSAPPAGSRAVGRNAFRSPAGALFLGNIPVAQASATSDATARMDASNRTVLSWVNQAGGAGMLVGATFTAWPAIPAGSVAVGANAFLTSDGRLFQGLADGGVQAVQPGATVTSAYADHDAQGRVVLTYITTTGAFTRILGTGVDTPWAGVPVNATAVGRQAFLTPDGRFYVGGAVVQRGVTSAAVRMNSNNQVIAGYVQSGTC